MSLNLALAGQIMWKNVSAWLFTFLFFLQTAVYLCLRRYVKFWVPLFCKALPKDREKLVAPLDVEYVWCCHMLCPLKFTEDLQLMSDGKVRCRQILSRR